MKAIDRQHNLGPLPPAVVSGRIAGQLDKLARLFKLTPRANYGMCGRFTVRARLNLIAADFGVNLPPDLPPRYKVAPTQSVPVVRQVGSGDRQLDLLHWGLIPSWADDPKIGNKMINARADGVATKPSFRSAFKQR